MKKQQKENNKEQDLPLVAFEKTLLREEAVLIHDYASDPTFEILSRAFDIILNEEKE